MKYFLFHLEAPVGNSKKVSVNNPTEKGKIISIPSFLHHSSIEVQYFISFRTAAGRFVGFSSTAQFQSPESVFNLFPLLVG